MNPLKIAHREWLATLPAGFAPQWCYPDGSEGTKEACFGVAVHGDLAFYVDGGFPALPLKACGSIPIEAWDIPFRWAIDASAQAWMDNAHGGLLCKTTAYALMNKSAHVQTRQRIRAFLGLPDEEPAWMAPARAAGWGPKDA